MIFQDSIFFLHTNISGEKGTCGITYIYSDTDRLTIYMWKCPLSLSRISHFPSPPPLLMVMCELVRWKIWAFSSSGQFGVFLKMAKNGFFSRLRRVEKDPGGVDGFSACVDSDEVHVLAVDDSLVDRKVIERLLKITSCKGNTLLNSWDFGGLFWFWFVVKFCGNLFIILIWFDFCSYSSG